MNISKEKIVAYFKMHLTYVEISKIAGVTPQRIKQIVEKNVSKKEIEKIKQQRSIYKAVWSRCKTKQQITNEIINEAKKYADNHSKILWKRDSREIDFD